MAFGAIKDLLRRFKKLDQDAIFVKIIRDPGMEAQIIDLNTTSQLYEKGIDSKGRSLGDYSARTIAYKREHGQRYDHITLQDSGTFYRSFKVITGTAGFAIIADARKAHQDLAQVFGNEILGLTDESIEEIKPEIRERFIEETRAVIFGG